MGIIPEDKKHFFERILFMKYTKYTLLAMSALALGTVGTKAPHLASANQSVGLRIKPILLTSLQLQTQLVIFLQTVPTLS